MKGYTKDPDEHVDYGWDWATRLLDGESIDDSEWIVPTTDLIDTDEQLTGTTTVIWLAGGIFDSRYLVTNRVTTNQGRVMDWSFVLTIHSR